MECSLIGTICIHGVLDMQPGRLIWTSIMAVTVMELIFVWVKVASAYILMSKMLACKIRLFRAIDLLNTSIRGHFLLNQITCKSFPRLLFY